MSMRFLLFFSIWVFPLLALDAGIARMYAIKYSNASHLQNGTSSTIGPSSIQELLGSFKQRNVDDDHIDPYDVTAQDPAAAIGSDWCDDYQRPKSRICVSKNAQLPRKQSRIRYFSSEEFVRDWLYEIDISRTEKGNIDYETICCGFVDELNVDPSSSKLENG